MVKKSKAEQSAYRSGVSRAIDLAHKHTISSGQRQVQGVATKVSPAQGTPVYVSEFDAIRILPMTLNNVVPTAGQGGNPIDTPVSLNPVEYPMLTPPDGISYLYLYVTYTNSSGTITWQPYFDISATNTVLATATTGVKLWARINYSATDKTCDITIYNTGSLECATAGSVWMFWTCSTGIWSPTTSPATGATNS